MKSVSVRATTGVFYIAHKKRRRWGPLSTERDPSRPLQLFKAGGVRVRLAVVEPRLKGGLYHILEICSFAHIAQ